MSDDELLERFKKIDKRWAQLEEQFEDDFEDSIINAGKREKKNDK